MRFKMEHSFQDRKNESERVMLKYSDRRPIICEKSQKTNLDEIDKKKYLVPGDLTLQQFIYVIRKRLHLNPETAIFLIINSKIIPGTKIISEVYDKEKDKDGFLYIEYTTENVFG